MANPKYAHFRSSKPLNPSAKDIREVEKFVRGFIVPLFGDNMPARKNPDYDTPWWMAITVNHPTKWDRSYPYQTQPTIHVIVDLRDGIRGRTVQNGVAEIPTIEFTIRKNSGIHMDTGEKGVNFECSISYPNSRERGYRCRNVSLYHCPNAYEYGESPADFDFNLAKIYLRHIIDNPVKGFFKGE